MATKKKSARKPAKKAASRAKAKSARPAKPARKAAKRAAARPAAKKTAPKGFSAVSAGFTVNDIEKSRAFWCDVVGFTEVARWDRDGRLSGLVLHKEATEIFLGQDDWAKGRDRKKGEGCRTYFGTTGDPAALAARMKEKGAVLEAEPQRDEWGHHFSFGDPDGYKFTVMNESQKAKDAKK